MGSFDPRAMTQAERGREEVQGGVLFCFGIIDAHNTPLPATAGRSFFKVSRD